MLRPCPGINSGWLSPKIKANAKTENKKKEGNPTPTSHWVKGKAKEKVINAMTMANGSFNRFASYGMDCDCVLLSVLVLLLVRLPTGFGFGYGFNISMPNTKYPRDGLPKCGSLVKKCAAQELTRRRDKRQGTREMSGSG